MSFPATRGQSGGAVPPGEDGRPEKSQKINLPPGRQREPFIAEVEVQLPCQTQGIMKFLWGVLKLFRFPAGVEISNCLFPYTFGPDPGFSFASTVTLHLKNKPDHEG